MSQLLDLYDYWGSYKKGKPNKELAGRIKQSLITHELHPSTALTFVVGIAKEGDFSEQAITDTMAIYSGIGLDEIEECGLDAEVLGNFLTAAKDYEVDKALVDATTTWNIFKNVDDENPLKKVIFHRTFDSIAYFGFYNKVDIVDMYSNYVREHNGVLLGLPMVISELIK